MSSTDTADGLGQAVARTCTSSGTALKPRYAVYRGQP